MDKKIYVVRPGFVIRVDERTTHEGGARLELDDKEAALHGHKIEAFDPALHATDEAPTDEAPTETKSKKGKTNAQPE